MRETHPLAIARECIWNARRERDPDRRHSWLDQARDSLDDARNAIDDFAAEMPRTARIKDALEKQRMAIRLAADDLSAAERS